MCLISTQAIFVKVLLIWFCITPHCWGVETLLEEMKCWGARLCSFITATRVWDLWDSDTPIRGGKM